MNHKFNNQFFDEVRPYLMRMTLLQIHQVDQAEEIVQETLLAAVESCSKFSGASTPRTWITGILKHKISDFLRSKYRAKVVSLDDETQFDKNLFDSLFIENGHWQTENRPEKWKSAEEAYQNRQFWNVLESCMRALPERTASIFVQREIVGAEIEELCQIFNVTATNVSVMLYRARMVLRECLEEKWVNTGESKP